MKIIGLAALGAAVVAAVPAAGATIDFGTNTTDQVTCAPGCTATVQYSISSALFSTAGYIDSLTFFLQPNAATPLSIYLGTAATGVGAMSSMLSANRGADFASFYNGTVAAGAAGARSFDGSFFYDPAMGDLLLEIRGDGLRNLTGAASYAPGQVQRVYTFNSFRDQDRGVVDADAGLTTRFGFTPAAVPEPSTWMLMLAGFAAVGYGMRRRRSVHFNLV
ncbi:PEPxxWA-CTERM sorting domain-containing protein [Sphingomonas sp. DT-51]|uniref:PEPxxWA-CTERM sorting domain-containing protein n=1 Tax=Sphingomonas sp. DT-51 TaxID=3396165 RepID=UPI003F19EB0E